MALPSIIIYEHVWELQWAVDIEDAVYSIKHPEPIGNTAVIAGCVLSVTSGDTISGFSVVRGSLPALVYGECGQGTD
jgi:hypothetical protein